MKCREKKVALEGDEFSYTHGLSSVVKGPCWGTALLVLRKRSASENAGAWGWQVPFCSHGGLETPPPAGSQHFGCLGKPGSKAACPLGLASINSVIPLAHTGHLLPAKAWW